MFDKDHYGKILVPMITPFKEDQSIDFEAMVGIAEKLIDGNKADSIILTGTMGEFFSMTFEERVRIFEVVKEAVGDRIPLIAGTGFYSTSETIRLSRKAEELGYDLLMIVTPYYINPGQKEIYSHFKRIAGEVGINIILYNIPRFAGVNISPETAAELSRIENIVGIKEEAERNPKQVTAFINATPDDFIIYCGGTTMVLEVFAQGGGTRIGGIVSGAAHLIGDRLRDMINKFLSGQVEEAARMQQRFLPLFRSFGLGERGNPISLLKEVMKLAGFHAGLPRLPLLPGTDEEIAELRKTMEELNIL